MIPLRRYRLILLIYIVFGTKTDLFAAASPVFSSYYKVVIYSNPSYLLENKLSYKAPSAFEPFNQKKDSSTNLYLVNFNDVPDKKESGVTIRLLPILDLKTLMNDRDSYKKNMFTLFEITF